MPLGKGIKALIGMLVVTLRKAKVAVCDIGSKHSNWLRRSIKLKEKYCQDTNLVRDGLYVSLLEKQLFVMRFVGFYYLFSAFNCLLSFEVSIP